VLGLGIGLFYSSITTAAVTSLDASRSSPAGGIVYMCQVAGAPSGWASTPPSSAQAELARHDRATALASAIPR
jgi:hypothetical protein